jgi:hypothetical protein
VTTERLIRRNGPRTNRRGPPRRRCLSSRSSTIRCVSADLGLSRLSNCLGHNQGSSPESKRSLSTFEPVSVASAKFRLEKVWRGQRPGRQFRRRVAIPDNRDRAVRRLRRQSYGKSKTIPSASGNRSCAGVGGGAGRTRTSKQIVMNSYQTCASAGGPSICADSTKRPVRRAAGRHPRISLEVSTLDVAGRAGPCRSWPVSPPLRCAATR